MLNRWNIPEEHHGAFTACTTETQLLDAQAPMDVVERVLNLVFSKDAVAIAEEPSYIIPSGQKLEEYVEGKISRFLLNLDDKQLELVDWALEGPTLIKGGPGSGKSTVAMYRARAIIDNAIQHGQKTPRILFTTYVNALVNVNKELLSQLLTNYDADIDVRTPDSIARSCADKSLKKYTIESGDIWLKAIEEVRPIFKPSAGSALQNSMLLESIKNVEDDYIAEEIQIIIEGRGLDNIEAYIQTERARRGLGLTERQRQTIWQLYVTAEK